MSEPTREERRLGRIGAIPLGDWLPDPERPGWVHIPATAKQRSVHRNVADPGHVAYWKRTDLLGLTGMAVFISVTLLFVMYQNSWAQDSVLPLTLTGLFIIGVGVAGVLFMRKKFSDAVRLYGLLPPDPDSRIPD